MESKSVKLISFFDRALVFYLFLAAKISIDEICYFCTEFDSVLHSILIKKLERNINKQSRVGSRPKGDGWAWACQRGQLWVGLFLEAIELVIGLILKEEIKRGIKKTINS